MATSWGDLCEDVRGIGVGMGSRGKLTDRTLLRSLWHAVINLVSELADNNPTWPILPRETSEIDLTRSSINLADGLEITGTQPVARVAYVAGVGERAARVPVTLVSERDRDGASGAFGAAFSFPAAYIAGEDLRPIPRPGTPWTHDSIRSAGWRELTRLLVEYIQLVAQPRAMQEVISVDVRLHRPAVSRVAADFFASRVLDAEFHREKLELLGQAGRGPANVTDTTRERY